MSGVRSGIVLALLIAMQATGQEPAPSGSEGLARAFPDLGGMEARYMMLEDPWTTFVLFDELERGDDDSMRWDFRAWTGRDDDKLRIRSEGSRETGRTTDASIELLWSHTVASWWDAVVGVRHDLDPGPSRDWAAFGVQGFSPYEFDVEATAYLGDGGRASLKLKADYELLLTQRLILKPLAELEWYSTSDVERGIGSGLARSELGLRLRYEIRRELAPYIGIARSASHGRTGDLAALAGGARSDTRIVAGLRLWF
jgi:copper resistance protein B